MWAWGDVVNASNAITALLLGAAAAGGWRLRKGLFPAEAKKLAADTRLAEVQAAVTLEEKATAIVELAMASQQAEIADLRARSDRLEASRDEQAAEIEALREALQQANATIETEKTNAAIERRQCDELLGRFNALEITHRRVVEQFRSFRESIRILRVGEDPGEETP